MKMKKMPIGEGITPLLLFIKIGIYKQAFWFNWHCPSFSRI